eukprot:4284611-Pleurochrysis_carterae.AAC.1
MCIRDSSLSLPAYQPLLPTSLLPRLPPQTFLLSRTTLPRRRSAVAECASGGGMRERSLNGTRREGVRRQARDDGRDRTRRQ